MQKFKLRFTAVDQCTVPAPSTSLGLTSVVARFSETGDFTNPDFIIPASGSPSLNDGIFYDSSFVNIPSTTWGQSSNGCLLYTSPSPRDRG